MPATRKKAVTSNPEDLMQMKSLFGHSGIENDETEEHIEPVAVETSGEKFKTDSTPLSEKVHQIDPTSNIITEEKREVSDTTVGIRMTTAKKREMKAYFIQHGTTMSQGVIDAFALLKVLEEEGMVEYKDGILERV